MSSVKISQLNLLSVNSISTDDFIPFVDSGSLTTYRVSVDDFNDWMAASGSAISASYAKTASFIETASFAKTASYAITSSYSHLSNDANFANIAYNADEAETASYAKTASVLIGGLDTASYAKTSSICTHTASFATSASYALSSSYGYSGSYTITASYAITASSAITASYSITTSPNSLIYPLAPIALSIFPSWNRSGTTTYTSELPFQQIVIQADGLVLYNSAGTNSKVLSYVTVLNDRLLGSTLANTGSANTYTANNWHNLWVIYNSTTGDVSSLMDDCGASPGITSPTMPVGYDYKIRVACIKDDSSLYWREWYEYGARLRWIYRNNIPSNAGLSGGGYTLTHYFGYFPRTVDIRLKVKQLVGSMNSWGYAVGDEFRAADFINDSNSDSVETQVFGTACSISPNKTFRVWRTPVSSNTIKSGIPSTGIINSWTGIYQFENIFDMYTVSDM